MKQNEREIIVEVLTLVTKEGAYNNIALKKALDNSSLTNVQRAFITEVTNGTLRNLIFIDFIINSFSKTYTTKMKPFILNVLRSSTYQIIFMNKVPASAAVNEAVALSKKRGFVNLSGFVNGVLRSIERGHKQVKLPDIKKQPVEYLSTKYSYDKWLIEYWLSEFNFETVEKICIANNTAPQISICVNTIKTNREELVKTLEAEGASVKLCETNNLILYIKCAGSIAELQSFKNGLFHVCDESSVQAVQSLAPKKCDKVLDVCSAPGGKSFVAAYLMENSGEIHSLDIHEHKIKLVKEGAERLGIDIISVGLNDATRPNENFYESYDKVLIDAPCTGFGILRKKPDIMSKKSMEDVKNLAQIQRNMLQTSAKYVKPLGIIVYSTCTLSKMENSDNINWFKNNFNFKLLEEKQLLPEASGRDGFYIAKLQRCE